MSVTRRLIHGNVASWSRIATTFLSQFLLVPVFLSVWNLEIYGAWLTLQIVLSFVQILDIAHQEYVGNNFLRVAHASPERMGVDVWSGVWGGLGLGTVQFLVVLGLGATGAFEYFFDNPELAREAFLVTLAHSVSWWIFGSAGGVVVRAVVPFGYFAATAWWGVGLLVGTQLAAVSIAVWSRSFLWAGVAQVAAGVLLNIPFLFWCWRRMGAHGMCHPCFDGKQSLLGVVRSQMLTMEKAVDFLRQQGIRLMLAPLVGTAAVAIFATTRTGANLALQGLSTITGPLMPELMRFLSRREQEKTELAFGIVWVPMLLAMCPGIIVLQVVVNPLFVIWTRGKVAFDPLLFAVFSMSIIVSAAAQPATAVVRGNNLLTRQFALAVISGVAMLGTLVPLVHFTGILGAGIALLVGELAAAIGYMIVAAYWLRVNHMSWPHGTARLVGIAVVGTSGTLFLMAYLQAAGKDLEVIGVALLGLAGLGYLAFHFWTALPLMGRERIIVLCARVPGFQRMLALARRPAGT